MKPIGGIPMIGILIDRLKQSGLPIILATSFNKENDILIEYANSLGVIIFCGSEENVLERFYLAAKSVKAKVIIRVTGDNPLVDGYFLRRYVEQYLSLNDYRAYLSTGLSQTWPLGISVEVFSFELLDEAFHKATLPGQWEHVTPYMHQNVPGDIKIIKPCRNGSRYHYRLTVDTEDDWKLNCRLIEEYKCAKKSIEEIIHILDDNQDLVLINQNTVQKSWNTQY